MARVAANGGPKLSVRRVNFFVAGVQKGGTTALDALLRGHPMIRMARVKEPHFFDDESIDWQAPDYDNYHALFDLEAPSTVVGEATPIYSYWPKSLDRIATYNSNAKIVLSLRHPTHRAHSHWRMEMSREAERLPFSAAIREPGRRRIVHDEAHRVFSYVERGFYSEQVRAIQERFPAHNVFFFRTDQLWREPSVLLSRLLSFLGAQDKGALDAESRYIVPGETRSLGRILPVDRKYLDDLFAADIRATACLTGVDLSDWLDPAYEEPMGAKVET
jgi:hypothetical protein